MKLRHITDPTARTGNLFDNLSVEECMTMISWMASLGPLEVLGPLEAPTAQRSYHGARQSALAQPLHSEEQESYTFSNDQLGRREVVWSC